jgi:hypothetical protein
MKGNILAIALKRAPMGKKKDPEGDAEETDDEGDGEDMGLQSAMGDFIKAVKSGDSAGAAKAFREAHEMCGNYDDKDDEEE